MSPVRANFAAPPGSTPTAALAKGEACLHGAAFDAARKEHVVQEAAALAEALPSLQPQQERYKNSPIKVIGEHDEGTVAQMRNCMSVGNAVAGVLCADGHLGYAQPVGAVIAYEKQISISGVGFDIGCGNLAVRLDTPFSQLHNRVDQIKATAAGRFLRHRQDQRRTRRA